ncbi:PAS domain-containing protein [Acidobacteria bacterium AB60]|nr:PAS domain-containing protein [Acidobacteria bacterium AB60]
MATCTYARSIEKCGSETRLGHCQSSSSGGMLFLQHGIAEDEGVDAGLGRAAVGTCSHAVHFYESEPVFLDSLSEFVGGALGAGGVCVIIASQSHFEEIARRLRGFGVDLDMAADHGRYVALDAREMLARFMRDGWPDRQLFFELMEPVFVRAREALRGRRSCIVAFGEMVSILCEEDKFDAALRLEQLWNELSRRQVFSLRCGYPLSLFATEERRASFQRLCAEHKEVIPAESFSRMRNSERWRAVSSLQQQASTLQAAIEMRQREIEERLRVEEKLRRTEEIANTIMQSTADCIKVLDLKGGLEFMNAAGVEAMEISDPGGLVGKSWIELWQEEDRPRVRAALAESAAGFVGGFQAECRTFGGKSRYWDVRITPARGGDGRIERLIAISRDMTELRNAQLAVLHAEKLATAGRMAATIAHEINNPLEAVTNFIFLALSSEGVPEEVRRYLEIADRELTRVAHIARQTLGFYRSTSLPRVLPVADFIRDALMIYERRLRNKELRVEVSVHPDLKVYGKEGELRQALLNLVANAIDACDSGGRIWVRAQRAKNWTNGLEQGIRLTLADDGMGMSPEVQKRIFDPFFTTKAGVGTGIGLWITKSLIEQRGGYLHFRSRQGEGSGTVMSLFLPSNLPLPEEAVLAAD